MVWITQILTCFFISLYYYCLLFFFLKSNSSKWIKDDLQVNHYVTMEPFTQSVEEGEDIEEVYDAELFFISFYVSWIHDTVVLGILLFVIEYF